MILFDSLTVGESTYTPKELTFNQALKVAMVDAKLNEKRLSVFLQGILSDEKLPLKMTAQERYYLLLHYLDKQNNTLFSVNINVSDFMLKADTEWRTQLTQNGITVRQLTGFDAEYLETKCVNAAEWIACMMAMQLACESHEDLGQLPDRMASEPIFEAQFKQRLEVFKNLPQSDFDKYYQSFIDLNNQLYQLVRLSVGRSGLLVLRGADDAPIRFCPAAAFIGLIKELDRSFT